MKPNDRRRLAGQNKAILERLRQGPATNADLAKIALKYTSRISDIRKHLAGLGNGETVDCKDLGGGVTEYRIRVRVESMKRETLFGSPKTKRRAGQSKSATAYDPPPPLHSATRIPSRPAFLGKCLTAKQWSRLAAWIDGNWPDLRSMTAGQILNVAKNGSGKIPKCPVRSLDINAIYEGAKKVQRTIYEPESKFTKGNRNAS